MTSVFDTLIAITIVGVFFFIIGSKVYSHEKDTIDPLIKKIKGWFEPKEEEESDNDPGMDYDINYRGYSNF